MLHIDHINQHVMDWKGMSIKYEMFSLNLHIENSIAKMLGCF